jgi:cytidylate kinase
MNLITVSREYGAGGAEVAQRLAEALGWELLDRELLHQAAAVEHIPDAELEKLDEHEIGVLDRFRLHPPHERYLHGLKEAVKQAAARGKVIFVGRGCRQLVGDTAKAFHLRLAAPFEWRAQRMAGRERWTIEQSRERCAAMDRTRDRFTRYFFGTHAADPGLYHLIVNTGRVRLDAVADAVAKFARSELTASSAPSQAVVTLARELGSGDAEFIPVLAGRLGLRVYDRELLEREAQRLGVTEAELRDIEEKHGGLLQRLFPGNLYHRYVEALGRLHQQLAGQGGVLLVGRGGSGFLADLPGAVHLRLVAPLEARLRHVMERHWMREAQARNLVAESDARRSRLYEVAFNARWTDPLEYHATINGGRLTTEHAANLTAFFVRQQAHRA